MSVHKWLRFVGELLWTQTVPGTFLSAINKEVELKFRLIHQIWRKKNSYIFYVKTRVWCKQQMLAWVKSRKQSFISTLPSLSLPVNHPNHHLFLPPTALSPPPPRPPPPRPPVSPALCFFTHSSAADLHGGSAASLMTLWLTACLVSSREGLWSEWGTRSGVTVQRAASDRNQITTEG